MAGTDRNIRKSIMARVRAMLVDPPTGSELNPYTVYNELDLLAISKSGKTPAVRPYAFLLDAYMTPKAPLLPMVVVEVPLISQRPYELGNRKGRSTDAMVHCFGRRRGERDDLASLFCDYWGATFPIYQYVSGAGADVATFLENAELTDEILIEERTHVMSQEERREGSLDLWQIVHISFRTKN